jgi:hypothetical protein
MYVCMYEREVNIFPVLFLSGCEQDGQGEAEEAAEQAAQHSPETTALHCHYGARLRLGRIH